MLRVVGGREGKERYGGRLDEVVKAGGGKEREVWRGELKGEGKARAAKTRGEPARTPCSLRVGFGLFLEEEVGLPSFSRRLVRHGFWDFWAGSAFLCTERGAFGNPEAAF